MGDTDDFVHWAFMVRLGGFPNGTTVYIAGESDLTAGDDSSMELKLGRKMNCSYVLPPMDGNPSVQSLAQFQASEASMIASRLLAAGGVGGMGPLSLSCKD